MNSATHDSYLCRSCTEQNGGQWPTWAKEHADRGECSQCGGQGLVLSDAHISWPSENYYG